MSSIAVVTGALILGKNKSRQHFEILFLFFEEDRLWQNQDEMSKPGGGRVVQRCSVSSSLGCPTGIGLQLGKACYPRSR